MTAAPHTTGHRIDRNDLLARTNLSDVLDALTTGESNGHRRAWRCPERDHPDEHPSVTISVDRRGIERWRCWSGGHGGTAIDAVIASRNLSVGDAVRWLDDNYAHLEPLQRPARPEPRPVGRPASEVIEYVERCEKLLWTGSGLRIREWLNARGLEDAVLAANRVGADPGRRYLPRARGLPAGWPAAVYPALDLNGDIAYFQARLIDPADGRPKYDNPASRWASNPRIAWTQHAAGRVRAGAGLVVTEGIPDALVAAQAGFASVGILGSTYPDRNVATRISDGSRAIGAKRVVICFDADDAGSVGGARLKALLEGSDLDVIEVRPPTGLDLSDWARTGSDLAHELRVPDASRRSIEISGPPSAGIHL